MKTMKIEKQLMFADTVKNVAKLEVSDGLQYRHESDGIRAIGPLFIRGQYVGQDDTLQSFQEVLDMDILAPQHKLSGKDFFIQIEEYHGVPQQESIHLYVTMSIHGLLEEHNEVRGEVSKKQIDTMQEEAAQLHMEQPVIPMKQPVADESKQIVTPVVPTSEETVEVPAEDLQGMNPSEGNNHEETNDASHSDQDTFDEFEDLFEDADTTYTSYRMIVAKANDTYASIAQRYEVDEAALRQSNHDKEVSEKTLVILP